jgi:PAS domain S-box-containing protein
MPEGNESGGSGPENERRLAQVTAGQGVVAEGLARTLEQERDTLQAIMESSRAQVAYLDPQFDLVRVNSAYADAAGQQRGKLLGRNHFELFPNPEKQAIFAQARDTGQPVEYRATPLESPGGPQQGVTYWDWRLVPVKDRSGHVQGLLLTAEDVTGQVVATDERERLLAENRAQRELLEHLVEAAPVGIAVLRGPAHRYELVNPAYQAIPGTPGTPVAGRTMAEVFPDAVARGAEQFVSEVYSTGQAVGIREAEAAVGPGREQTYWNVDHIPLHGPEGQVEQVLILAHEVTDQVLARRQAEDLASEAQQRAEELDAVFAALGDAVVVYDAGGVALKANPAAASTFGLDLVGADWADLARSLAVRHPDGRPVPVGELPVNRALRGERVTEVSLVLKNALGQELTLLASAAPLFSGGEVSGAVAAWHDITEQSQVERALRESEEKLGKLFEILPIGISVLDRDRNVVKANPALSRILDLSVEELVHGGFRERSYLTAEGQPFPPHHFPSVRALDEQRAVQDIEIGVAREDGERIWTSVSAVPVPLPDWEIVVVTADVTERKRAEEALRKERDFTAAVLDTSGGLVVVLDRQGRIVRFNRACEQATGYLFEEVQGRAFWDFLLIPEEVGPVKAAFVQLQAGQAPDTFENYWLAKDGSRRWIAWSNTVLAGGSGSIEYVIGTGIDITERRRAEEELQRALDRSQERQAEVSALLDGARQVLAQQSFEDTARFIFDICKDLTGATAGYVALSSRDGRQNDVLFLESGGRPCTVDPALPMPIRGLRGQVFQTGSVAYENDFQSSQWAQYLPEGHVAVDSLLFAPLVISGQVVGLLGLANKPGGFTENDACLTGAFAELAAIALHNSRLMGSLEVSELRFRSVVETANAAIVTADNRGLISFWNRMAEKLFGFTAQEMVGSPLTRIMPERFSGAHQAAMQRVLSTGETRLAGETVETIGARKGGEEFPLELSLATWKTGEGSFFTALMHDISQRKQTEEALREAKQSMETLIAASPLAIIALDLDLSVRLWNPAAERIFGWSEEEVLGRPYPLVPEARQKEFEGFLAQALAGQALSGREAVRQKKDGSPIDVSIWTSPLYDAEGTVRNVMAVIADISDRKRAEEALHHFAHEQTALYTVTSAVAGTLDQGELLPLILDAVLPALEADAGWILLPNPQPGEPPRVVAQGGTVEGRLAGETLLPSQECPIYQGLSTGYSSQVEPGLVVDCSALAAMGTDGSKLDSLVCVPLCAGQNVLGVLKIGWQQPYAYLEQGQDLLLSIGQQVGVALHSAQLYQEARQVNRLRALYELDRALAATLEPRELAESTLQRVATDLQAPAATVLLLLPEAQAQPVMQVFTPAGGWVEVTTSGQDVTGWQGFADRVKDQREPTPFAVEELMPVNRDPESAQAWGAHGLVVPIMGEKSLLALLVLGGRRADRPFTDEDRVLARVVASHAGQAMQNAQLYDEVRRLLHEQEEARAHMIQIEKLGALGRLAATIAHEINNPLQAVQSCLTLAQEEMDGRRRRDRMDRYLEVAGKEVERVSAIVGQMRDYYRPANERLQPTDLRVVLDSVLDLSGKELQHRNIAVERLDGSDLPMVQANPDHLRQVFLNLTLNAMDAMPAGGMLRVRTSPGQMQAGTGELAQAAVCVEISDTGHGMSPEIQARLFEPFVTTKEQGAGLGLSISYSIIEAHHGQISVTSEVGSGTTFSILLPVAPPQRLDA